MQYVLFTLVSVALVCTTAASEPRGYAFDPKTGTEFRWRFDATGNKHIMAFNRDQRTLWNLSIDPAGNRAGTDEQGDFWTFDLESGVYRNPGQNVLCFLNQSAPTCPTNPALTP